MRADLLRRGINRFRWVEYSISATLMVILIASYSGITEITAVFAITRRQRVDDPVRLAAGKIQPARSDRRPR